MTWWRRLFGGRDGGRAEPATSGAGGVSHGQDLLPPPAPGAPSIVDLQALPETRLLGTTESGLEVRGFTAPAEELVAWWHRLRAEHAETGLWPVLLGAEVGDLSRSLTPESRDGYDDAAELARAASLTVDDLPALRAERLAEYGIEGQDREPRGFSAPPRRVACAEPRFTVADTDGVVALVPAAHGWQVPVVLGWEGGVNIDMEPVDHAVVLRDWHERFGAELVALSGDQVLEVLVHRPPADPREALAVAREQWEYCSDIVEQGVGTLTALAQEQVGSRSWYFWWD